VFGRRINAVYDGVGMQNEKAADSDANKANYYPYWCKSRERSVPLNETVKSFAPVLLISELMFTNVMMLSIVIAIFR